MAIRWSNILIIFNFKYCCNNKMIFILVIIYSCFLVTNCFKIGTSFFRMHGSSRRILCHSTGTDKITNDLLVITNSESKSYFKTKPYDLSVTWHDVFSKIAGKMIWEGKNNKYEPIAGDLNIRIVDIESVSKSNFYADTIALVGLSINETSPYYESALSPLVASANAVTVFNCSSSISKFEKYGDFYPNSKNIFDPLLKKFDEVSNSRRNTDRKRYEIAVDLWKRNSLDDLVFLMFILIDTYGKYRIKSVQSVTSTEATSFDQVLCMCTNCSKEMIECFKDETCRKALDCLNNCKGNDQVCSYRCITSHETAAFEKFAMCILQKNNCMGNTATMPVYPDPEPMTTFRGAPLSFEDAENIFIGKLKLREGESNYLVVGTELLPWSWKVVCGQNPAYDYFACQHQLFYRDRVRPSVVWYDPVFKVTTLYGEDVWRRRHYRVRRAKQPGQFYFSVVDNGVVSNEYWRILDCADDLTWAVFYYSGAAAAAGTSYTGALVITPDGKWPDMTKVVSGSSETIGDRIEKALKRAEIEMWELFEVNNESCCGVDADGKISNPPPLGLPS